jgi:hypothetical protein
MGTVLPDWGLPELLQAVVVTPVNLQWRKGKIRQDVMWVRLVCYARHELDFLWESMRKFSIIASTRCTICFQFITNNSLYMFRALTCSKHA